MKIQNYHSSRSKHYSSSQAPRLLALASIALILLFLVRTTEAAGTLSLKNSGDMPLQIRDHQVSVTIQNGFARTEVHQTFFNGNDHTVEGLYTFPVPKSGSLSEVAIKIGEVQLTGEVVKKETAQTVYEEETSRGHQAGLAENDNYRDFEFWIAPIDSSAEVELSFVYYEPLELDHGIGRYVYPLEEGGTDEVVPQFWSRNDKISGPMAIDVELKSAWPIADIRTPGFETIQTESELGALVHWESVNDSLSRDFVLYYRLQDNLPARIEVVPYKDGSGDPGTFMMVVTPGIDLQPLTQGGDYVFVLDVSGSMAGKLGTLVAGVKKTLRSFRPEDRFRIILFNNKSEELTRGWVSATMEQVDYALSVLDRAQAGGGTNLYAGLDRGLQSLDSDRVTSFILVTDGVTNTGIVERDKFARLMSQADIRFFGFLLGNQSNWPLLEMVCHSTGGYYQQVSNSDDIIGQILLAKNKVLHESIHDFDLQIKGGGVFDVSPTQVKKVLYGQQLVFFGRYSDPGMAKLEIRARISGKDEVYRTEFNFPDLETDNPEIERLWAQNRIQQLEMEKTTGRVSMEETDSAITDLALQYQLVTDYTSMLVLSDEQFQRYNIDRRNLNRMQIESQAVQQRSQLPAVNYRVDQNQPAFGNGSQGASLNGGGSGGSGAGAISPWIACMLAGFVGYLARKTFFNQ